MRHAPTCSVTHVEDAASCEAGDVAVLSGIDSQKPVCILLEERASLTVKSLQLPHYLLSSW